jgi:hypothetical protein
MPRLNYLEKKNNTSTPIQKKFEKYLEDNGFEITGYSYCYSYNGYRIRKDNREIEYKIFNGDGSWKWTRIAFEDYWNTCSEDHELKS